MNPSVILVAGNLQAQIITEEGGVLSKLTAHGESFLTETPWSSKVTPAKFPAPDESAWVNNWRGGWQLCAPNTGLPQSDCLTPAFHGVASQARWDVIRSTDSSLDMRWTDERGEIEISRSWTLFDPEKVIVSSVVTNNSETTKAIGVAEHLILGSDFLSPIRTGSTAKLEFCPEAQIIELDYSGAPTGRQLSGADTKSDWTKLTRNQPARVFALANSKHKALSVELDNWIAEITWEGLEHALVWQEFGTSKDSPWNGEVFALGLEPTNIAHGLGANDETGPFIQPKDQLHWSTTLQLTRKVLS
jgi:hypothetical protein